MHTGFLFSYLIWNYRNAISLIRIFKLYKDVPIISLLLNVLFTWKKKQNVCNFIIFYLFEDLNRHNN